MTYVGLALLKCVCSFLCIAASLFYFYLCGVYVSVHLCLVFAQYCTSVSVSVRLILRLCLCAQTIVRLCICAHKRLCVSVCVSTYLRRMLGDDFSRVNKAAILGALRRLQQPDGRSAARSYLIDAQAHSIQTPTSHRWRTRHSTNHTVAQSTVTVSIDSDLEFCSCTHVTHPQLRRCCRRCRE